MADDDTGSGITVGRGFMLWQTANAWQRAARAALAPLGLTYAQVVLLAGLRDLVAAGGKVSQAALAQSLNADVMMTSQVLRALEADGLLRRDRDPDDTRARTLALTAEGDQLLASAVPLLALLDEGFFDPLGRKEERFSKSLRKLWRKRRLSAGAEGDEAKVEKRKAGKGEVE